MSSLAWNGTTLSSGGRDSLIINHDGILYLNLVFLFKVPLEWFTLYITSNSKCHRNFWGAIYAWRTRLLFDAWTVRVRDSTATFVGHSQEVCGLRWSLSGQQLASGGNDNLLHIWDAAVSTSSAEQSAPLFRLEGHQAAVKALAWCPYQNNLLASGGGTADRCIKFWNTKVGYCTNSIDTNSQVRKAARLMTHNWSNWSFFFFR